LTRHVDSQLLHRLDRLLDSFDPGSDDPPRTVGEIFRIRARQRARLEKVIRLASEALSRHPRNGALLRRRARAEALIATPDGKFPMATAADSDYERVLANDPENVAAGLEWLEHRFQFSTMADAAVAGCAATFEEKARNLLLSVVALHIRALGYAGQVAQARNVFKEWSRRLPDSQRLKGAMTEVADFPPRRRGRRGR